MIKKIIVVTDLGWGVSDVTMIDGIVVEPWWLPRVSGGEDGRLKMERCAYGLGSQQN